MSLIASITLSAAIFFALSSSANACSIKGAWLFESATTDEHGAMIVGDDCSANILYYGDGDSAKETCNVSEDQNIFIVCSVQSTTSESWVPDSFRLKWNGETLEGQSLHRMTDVIFTR